MTEADVRAASLQGRSVELYSGAIVTPAARDLAAKLGVAIHKGNPGRGDSNAAPAAPAAPTSTRIAVGSDHGGYQMKEFLKNLLTELGCDVEDVGCHSAESVDYPVYAARVAELIAAGEVEFGVMIDGAGIGSAMVGNKILGVRAALCHDITTATNAREHNNANMLTLGGTLLGNRLAAEVVKTFLHTRFAGGRHQRRVSMIDALDGERTNTAPSEKT